MNASTTEREGVAIAIKAQTANSFRKDALYNFENYKAVSVATHSSEGDGKLFTLILSAVETNLKAIRICFSPADETPECAFKIARDFGHRVKGLADNIEIIRPGWVRNLYPGAIDLLDQAEKCGGMNQRYDCWSGYDWFKPEKQRFLHAFSLLAIRIHTETDQEVSRYLDNAPLMPAEFREEINSRVARLK